MGEEGSGLVGVRQNKNQIMNIEQEISNDEVKVLKENTSQFEIPFR